MVVKRHLRWGLWTLLAVVAAAAFTAGTARAGAWIQVSCENPNGTAAPSEGWSGATSGGGAPIASVQCSPATPMTAELSTLVGAPAGAEAHLLYQPPAGSTLVGGTVQGTLSATASGANLDSSSYAGLYEPDFNPSSAFVECAALFPCNKTSDTLSGQFSLPSDRGGDLGVEAGCESSNGTACNLPQQNGTWAIAQVAWARLLLSSSVSPQGSGFSGSALNRRVRGTGHLVFTAAESAGPGIYELAVALDGRTVWAGTPNANGGKCVPVGSSSGALMFDYQQPCLTSEVVDAPVPTRGFPDGQHELAVSVLDAAGNASTVLDQTITTSNPQTTPAPRGRGALRARFVISWHWAGNTTQLRSIRVSHLPHAAGITVTCSGRHCPRLPVRHVNAPQASRLLTMLHNRRFHAGDRLHLTVSERHHRPERILLTVRPGREPLARLVR